ncbi:hypothetical protein AcW1_009672 [Taiwanofungus camphoratus]|nr:hypothetical protein AcW1_009672 [Antrodia cinnamomea]
MPSSSSFILVHSLRHHYKDVDSISVSPDGSLLLSDGDDALLVIWNLQSGEKLQEIQCLFHEPISAIVWIELGHGKNQLAFVFGCADGTLHIYEHWDSAALFEFLSLTAAHNGAVEDVDFDSHYGRIASIGSGTTEVWKLTPSGTMEKLNEMPPSRPYVGKNIHFCDNGASIVTYYLESHEIFCYSIEPWSLKWSKQIPTRIGWATLAADQNTVFISNLCDGMDQYRFPSMERIRSFPYAIQRNYPMQVAVDATRMVCGGDDGFARVFDQENGQFLESLMHGSAGTLVQTVEMYSDSN